MKFINIILLYLLFNYKSITVSFRAIDVWHEETINFTSNLFNTVFEAKRTVLVYLPDNNENIPRDWFKHLQIPVSIVSSNWSVNDSSGLFEPTQGYALWTEENNVRRQIKLKIEQVTVSDSFRSSEYMIIFVLRKNWLLEYSVKSILSMLWNRHKMSNVIITPIIKDADNASDDTVPHLYSYNMFSRSLMKPDKNGIIEELEKRFNDMNGYRLRVSLFKNYLGYYRKSSIKYKGFEGTGIDGEFLQLVSKKLNFTPLIVPPRGEDYGETVHETKFIRSMKQVARGLVDVSFNGRYIKNYNLELMYSHVILEDKICVVVAPDMPYRGWEIFYKACDETVWACIILAFVSVTLSASLISRIETGKWNKSFLHAARSMFSMPMSSTPKSSPLRIVVAVCLLFAIVLMTLFQGYLFHMIHTSPKKHLYTSLKDIHDLEIIQITGAYNETFHLKDNPKNAKKIQTKIKTSYGFPKGITLSNCALVISKSHFNFLIDTRRFKPDEKPHMLNDCPRSYNLAYIFPRGSPFYKIFNEKYVSRVFEANLNTFWYHRLVSHMLQHKLGRNILLPDHEKEEDSIPLGQLEVSFFILLVGYTISILIFLQEIFISLSKIYDKNKIKKKLSQIAIILNKAKSAQKRWKNNISTSIFKKIKEGLIKKGTDVKPKK